MRGIHPDAAQKAAPVVLILVVFQTSYFLPVLSQTGFVVTNLSNRNVYNNARVRVRARARAKDRGLRPLEYSIPTASTFHTHTPSYVFSLV